jgi:RNA polymerase sigma factor (sigma-70 family)
MTVSLMGVMLQVYVVPTASNNNQFEQDDSVLVRQCLDGQTQSFRLLYQRHHPRVRSTLYQLCDSSNLDDLIQEVFLRAWKGLPKFRQTAKFSTWLYRIAWNVASDQRQSLARGRTQLQVLSHQVSRHQVEPDVMSLHYQDLVKRGLTALSLDHRTVLVLHDLEEVPQREISEILDIPLGTVKSRLFHARGAMRQFLEREGVQL